MKIKIALTLLTVLTQLKGMDAPFSKRVCMQHEQEEVSKKKRYNLKHT